MSENDIVRIKCGKIFLLNTDYFSLVCECCKDNFFTLEDLQAHLNENFPEAPFNIKKEDGQLSTPPLMLGDITDNLAGNLQDTNGSNSNATDENSSLSISNNTETVECQQSEKNQRKLQPKRTYKLQPRLQQKSENQNGNFSEKKCKKDSRCPRNRVQKPVPLKFNFKNEKQKVNNRKKPSSKPKTIKSSSSLIPKKPERRKAPSKSSKADLQCSSQRFSCSDALSSHKNIHTGHKCLVCNSEFISKYLLDVHTREKHLPDTDPRRYFPCLHCNEKFKSLGKRDNHRRSQHKDPNKRFICHYCQKQFVKKTSIVRHMIKHSGNHSFPCKHCDKSYADKSSRYQHQRNCFERFTNLNHKNQIDSNKTNNIISNQRILIDHERPHQCHICSETFRVASSLSLHLIRMHLDDQRYICRVCDTNLFNKSLLERHLKENHLSVTDPNRYFSCEICDLKFTTHGHLHRHRRNIHYRHKCSICSKTFARRKAFMIHLKSHAEGSYKCLVCDIEFISNHKLDIHTRETHLPDNDFLCKVCDVKFKTYYQLCYHKTSHHSKKDDPGSHKCLICSKTYARKNNLVLHVKSHADDRPYKCLECDKSFLTNNMLVIHTRENHLPDSDPRRYFPCKICNVKLKSYNQMANHKRTHRIDPNRRFICHYCQQKFKKKYTLIQHMVKHSGKASFPCKHCDNLYVDRGSRLQHQRKCVQRTNKKDSARTKKSKTTGEINSDLGTATKPHTANTSGFVMRRCCILLRRLRTTVIEAD